MSPSRLALLGACVFLAGVVDSLAGGGGRSPRTREALFRLMEAMELDNAERPTG